LIEPVLKTAIKSKQGVFFALVLPMANRSILPQRPKPQLENQIKICRGSSCGNTSEQLKDDVSAGLISVMLIFGGQPPGNVVLIRRG